MLISQQDDDEGEGHGIAQNTVQVYTKMVQRDWDTDDRSQQQSGGHTSDCISTRRRWQKSSNKVKYIF